MSVSFRALLSPPAELTQFDTGLRFTDILFGFVIRELFLRLQNWAQLPSYVLWHLIVGAALVLGSWIGFRRSVYRSAYEVKFINLPLLRFLVDQLLIILYFRISVLTTVEGIVLPTADQLAEATASLLVSVFVLYAVWDLLGIALVKARKRNTTDGAKPKYPEIREDDRKITDKWQRPNVWGFTITMVFLGLFVGLWCFAQHVDSARSAVWVFSVACLFLVIYRVAKEARTTWLSLSAAA
jgi:hypothetical protein